MKGTRLYDSRSAIRLFAAGGKYNEGNENVKEELSHAV
jgi:hypothetical protein